jgi:alkanesulfonate monooxygenase SsuD/methylene tetrahydromethanopterin reductase-like flavin-dependent oxidoreductase (luciferase family)
MEYGIGLDATLSISYEQDLVMSNYAAESGYTSVWTPENRVYDSFVLCLERWNSTKQSSQTGITTGIGVSPVNLRSPFALAMTASTISKRTNGNFILGIGSGSVYREATRNSLGLTKVSVLSLMTDYLSIIKPLVQNQTVNYTGKTISLLNANLGSNNEYPTPIYLAALGPKMLAVGAKLADGIALNWCSTDQIEWSREIIKIEAEKNNRDPKEVQVVQYIRMCIDDNVELARKAFIQSMLGYALGSPTANPLEKRMGYRGHFERMGFSAELNRLDKLRSEGASQEKLIDSFPDELALKVGYFGKPEGAKNHFIKLSEGLDTAIVRVVAAKPEINSTKIVIDTCKP